MINSFSGEYRWLSNFWPCCVILDGMQFNSVEAAYVAAKTLCIETRKKIQSMDSAGKCKKFGKSLALRGDWEYVKIDVMRDLLSQKFAKDTDLAKKLILTGSQEIVEGNTWGDTFWGVCGGVGENNLGKLIMQIRDSIK